MGYRYLFSLFLSLLITGSAIAQTGSIRGTVTTSDDEPAPFVNISLKGTPKGTVVDESGKYEIRNVKAGEYTLVASFVGLKTQEQQVEVKSGETTTLNVSLEENATQLEEIVVSEDQKGYNAKQPSKMLRLKTPLVETPQNIQVITEEVLEDQQVIDMTEKVIRNVSGAQRLEHWNNYARINMRGFKLPAFRNGMNVEMPWGPLTEDMAMVERIEFVKGPAGFMLAAGEPGGFYNVVTKKPNRYHQNKVSLMAGSFNTLRATADIGGKLDEEGKLLYRLNLMGSNQGSHRPYEFNKRFTFFPSLKYQIDENTSVTWEYTFQQAQMSALGSQYVFSPQGYGHLPRNFTTAEPNLPATNVKEHMTFLRFEHQFNRNWDITAQLAYMHYKQIGNTIWPKAVEADGDIQRGMSIWDALSESKMGQVFVNGDVTTGPVRHRILGGVDLSQKDYYADWHQTGMMAGQDNPLNIYQPQHGVHTDSFPDFNRQQGIRERSYIGGYFAGQSIGSNALYVQDELSFFNNRLRLTLAGRYTFTDQAIYSAETKDQAFTPRAGLSVSIDKNTSVYGLFDQSFLPQTGTDAEGNSFNPVEATDIEGGVKRDWGNGLWNSSLGVFQITKTNVVTSDPENPNFSAQLGEVVSQGVEFDVRGQVLPGLNAMLNYAYTNVEITEDPNDELVGNRLPGHANHVTNGWLNYRFRGGALKGLGIGAGYRYMIDRASWSFDNTDSREELPDYSRLDGSISWQNDKISVGLNVNNILDQYLYTGSDYGSYYYWQTEPGRNFRLKVGYKF